MWILLIPVAAYAQSYAPVDSKDAVIFSIKNFGVSVTDSFQGLNGTVKFDSEQPEQASFDVSIPVSTLQTGIRLRDIHLQQEYFESFPNIYLTSTAVKPGKNTGEFKVTGTLTKKGKPEEVTFPFFVTSKPGGRFGFRRFIHN